LVVLVLTVSLAGGGDDTLYDPDGVDIYIGGPGGDCIISVDHRRSVRKKTETVLAGEGRDRADAEKGNRLRNVERKNARCDLESVVK